MEYPQEHIVNQSGPDGDRTISYGDSPDQIIEIYGDLDSGSDQPTLVLLHGGYWRPTIDHKHLQSLAQKLSSLGFLVALVEYRREQGKPDQYLDDILQGVNKLNSSSFILIGHSAGGHLALLAGRKLTRCQGIIAISPVADLGLGIKENLGDGAINLYLGEKISNFSNLDPMQLSPPDCKIEIFHSDGDFIPVDIAKNYYLKKKLEGGSVNFTLVNNSDHFTLVDPRGHGFAILLQAIRAVAGNKSD